MNKEEHCKDNDRNVFYEQVDDVMQLLCRKKISYDRATAILQFALNCIEKAVKMELYHLPIAEKFDVRKREPVELTIQRFISADKQD